MEGFIVSARKYRPADFDSVVGQQHITDTLRNAIVRKQLAHAYLFCGPRGVGKTSCARIFARAINCMEPREGGQACGECESCRAFAEGRSFNIHELDAASNNSVDDIRALTEQLRIPPQIGRYSVYIIDEVHMLSAGAFNAFLKSLEEPPSYAIFILATTEKHKIIPTILSRCQIYDFNRIKVADAAGYLAKIAKSEGVEIDEQSLNLIAAKADGGMRDALSMFDKAVAFCGNSLNYKDVARTLNVLDYDTYFNIVDIIAAGDYRAAVLELDRVLAAGFSPQNFAAGLSNHFRDLLMCRQQDTRKLLEVTEILLGRYIEQAERWTTENLFAAVEELSKCDAGLRYATNQRLNVELCLMKLAGLKKKVDDDDELTLPEIGKTVILREGNAKTAESTPPRHSARSVSADAESTPSRHSARSVSADAESSVSEIAGQARNDDASVASVAPPEAPRIITNSQMSSIPSITAAMNASRVAPGEPASVAEPTIDPDSEAKLTSARNRFLDYIHTRRPRFAIAFEGLAIEGNRIKIVIPTTILNEEIGLHRAEIVTEYARLAEIRGAVELEITVSADGLKILPVKQDDIAGWLAEHNPAFTTLRKALALEY